MVRFGRIHVKIKGLTPILMNRLVPEELKEQSKGSPKAGRKKYDPEEEAAKRAYIDVIDGKRQLYIPNVWIYSMILQAAKDYTTKSSTGKKVSLSKLLAGAIRIEPEKIPLGTDKYEIDERPVRIQYARVLAWRPRINKWEAEFDIVYIKDLFTETMIKGLKEVLVDGGIRVGIGDYRPQHKGWFGTFTVEEFKIIE